jgi:transcriptional regulator with XRE-family HTH domain
VGGSARPARSEAEAADVYVAEQVIRLIRHLVARREQRGLRRRQLATMTGLRPNTVSDIENGMTWPDVRTLARIAWALDADLEFVPRRASRARDVSDSDPG